MESRLLLIKSAIKSRFILIVIQYFGNLVLPDHDAQVFQFPSEEKDRIVDKIVRHFLEGFVRWDAQYFMHIAKYGYSFENSLAFFPLYPLSARAVSKFFSYFVTFMNEDSLLLLIFIVINFLLFTSAVICLYDISCRLFDHDVSLKAAYIFCYNPASIFFLAPYTETMFCYLTFQSILNCIYLYEEYTVSCKFKIWHIIYMIPISLSTATRSNGILNLGYFLYMYICVLIDWLPKSNRKALYFIKHVWISLSISILIMVPFIVYQVYCYYMFCSDFDHTYDNLIVDYAYRNKFILPGQFSIYNQSWCHKKIPLAYSYVQNHYWDVGFLKYYQIKQIPNFLLAAPVLYIMIRNCCLHIRYNYHKYKNLNSLFSFNYLFRKKSRSYYEQLYCPLLNAFVVHSLFISIFCLFFVHIQVSTRMICSATPLLYWYCAKSICKLDRKSKSYFDEFENLIVRYIFPFYFVVGTVMFCNFLPWT